MLVWIWADTLELNVLNTLTEYWIANLFSKIEKERLYFMIIPQYDYIRKKGDLPENERTDISSNEVMTETFIHLPFTCSWMDDSCSS